MVPPSTAQTACPIWSYEVVFSCFDNYVNRTWATEGIFKFQVAKIGIFAISTKEQ